MSHAPPASTPAERPGAPARTVRVLRDKLIDLWRSRELLRQFVAKELKVRYKNSALGFLWSLLTPVLMTVVFTVVFRLVIRIEVVDYAAFFLGAFLVWQFFQNSVVASISCVVDNGPLIKKVHFPREILPLSIVLSQLIHFLLALLAVSPYLVWSRGWSVLLQLPAIAIGVALAATFTAGVAMFLAAANVFFRDLQELIVVIFMVWFYATPVLYPPVMVDRVEGTLGSVASVVVAWNPMTWFVRLIRETVYGTVAVNPAFDDQCVGACPPPFLSTGPSWPSPEVLVVTLAFAIVAFAVGYAMFHRFSRSFAKEI